MGKVMFLPFLKCRADQWNARNDAVRQQQGVTAEWHSWKQHLRSREDCHGCPTLGTLCFWHTATRGWRHSQPPPPAGPSTQTPPGAPKEVNMLSWAKVTHFFNKKMTQLCDNLLASSKANVLIINSHWQQLNNFVSQNHRIS